MLNINVERCEKLLESNTLFGLGVTFSAEEESMVNHFLLQYDMADQARDEADKLWTLKKAKAWFNYNQKKAEAVCVILTDKAQ